MLCKFSFRKLSEFPSAKSCAFVKSLQGNTFGYHGYCTTSSLMDLKSSMKISSCTIPSDLSNNQYRSFSQSHFQQKLHKKKDHHSKTVEPAITDLLESRSDIPTRLSTLESEGMINSDYLSSLIDQLSNSEEYRNEALGFGIEDDADWNSTISSFKYNILFTFDSNTEKRSKFKKAFKMAKKEGKDLGLMWNLYLQDLNEQIEEEQKYKITDLTEPHQLYPLTRLMKRKIIFHIGPTNSGKTYNAFKALREAKTGIYCAPLRLLATEAYVKLTSGDKPIEACELITGDFKIEKENATHRCSTTEMADVTREMDVAVIDEVQLITDPDRGWSWTKALLGVRAKEVHLCGEGRVLRLIQKLCEDTGDELEIKHYDRLTKLNISKSPTVRTLKDLEKGDCVVCFSRKEIFRIKNEIEKYTDLRVCVVYGGLPPQTRIKQAALFNHERSPYDVLVATDAIGMGLNLNIRRVIFSATEKFDGEEVRDLTPHEIKQIGGRAGRFNSVFEEGEVTGFKNADSIAIQKAFKYDPTHEEEQLRAGLFPTDEQIDQFYRQYRNNKHRVRLSTVLSHFYDMSKVNHGKYFMCDFSEKKDIANIIHPIENLTTSERMMFVKAPIDPDEALCKDLTFKWARFYSEGVDVPLLIQNPTSLKPINTLHKLKELELIHKCLNVYCWLSYRLEPFKEREKAFQYQDICRKLIEEALKQTVSLERKEKTIHRESRAQLHKHKTSKRISIKDKRKMKRVLEEYNLYNQ